MAHPLLVNSLVNLIIGAALVLAWRRHPEQLFLRALGLATLLQVLMPPAYLWWQASTGPAALPAGALMVASAAGHLLLMADGALGLAGRAPSRRQLAWFAGVLALLYGASLTLDARWGQALSATLNLAVGLVAARWLWPQPLAERVSGALLVLIGLNHFWFAVLGAEGVALQASLGTVLRTCLGLTLLYAALRRSGEAAQVMRDQYLRMTEHSHYGVLVIQGTRVVYANQAARRIYNHPGDQPFPVPWRSRHLEPPERERSMQRHRAIVAGELAHVQWEGHRTRHDGLPMYLRFAAWRIEWQGQAAEQVVVIDDTEHEAAAQALLHQATHDPLTGLPNRSALMHRLGALCGQQAPFALLMLDVDRFKLFNEAHGHTVGDQVLHAFAHALAEAAPAPAERLRLGEDEFALLLPVAAGDGDRAAQSLAGRVRERLQRPLQLPLHEFFVDASIGMALHPESGAQPEELLRAAQAAMHEAKRVPGLSVQMARPGFERGSGLSLAAEQALRAGLHNEEFVLVFQPKVAARGGRLTGFEALARWQRPGGAPAVGPADFIPAAERTGLISSLGALIIDKACAQVAEWMAAGEPLVPVAVNVSPLQLLDPAFPGMVARSMALHRVPPHGLSIEITETAAAMHLAVARERIAEFNGMSLRVALDDFGAGVSSLNILRSLQLQVVKIDRLLIEPLPAPDAVAVVRAVCQLASALCLAVVAEGVETAEQAAAAREAGCDELQGYHFSRPLPPAQARAWLRRAALAEGEV